MSAAGGWWIEAQGRLWGPYAPSRLELFKAQGRFGPKTLVAPSSEGPFAPAMRRPALQHLFDGPDTASAPAAAAVPELRALLVMADAGARGSDGFEAALGAHGESVQVRPGVWLLQARESAAGLRNALSRRVGPDGVLLIVEAPLSASAWFNLDGETDRALRRLWAGA